MLRNESRVCPTNLTQWLRVNLVWLAEDKYTCLELYRLAISDKRTRSKECQLKYLLGYKQNIPPCRFFFLRTKVALFNELPKKKKKGKKRDAYPPLPFSASQSPPTIPAFMHEWSGITTQPDLLESECEASAVHLQKVSKTNKQKQFSPVKFFSLYIIQQKGGLGLWMHLLNSVFQVSAQVAHVNPIPQNETL